MLQLESEYKAFFRFSKESISLFHVFWPQVFIFLYYCYSIVISSGALKISIINIPVWILYNQWKYFVFSFQDYMFKLPRAAWENYTFLQFRLKTPRETVSVVNWKEQQCFILRSVRVRKWYLKNADPWKWS